MTYANIVWLYSFINNAYLHDCFLKGHDTKYFDKGYCLVNISILFNQQGIEIWKLFNRERVNVFICLKSSST